MTLDKYPCIRETEIPETRNIFPVGSVLKVRMEFCAYPFVDRESIFNLLNKSHRVTSAGALVDSSWEHFRESNSTLRPGHVVFLLDSFRVIKTTWIDDYVTNNVWVFLFEEKRYMLMVPSYMSQQEFFDHT